MDKFIESILNKDYMEAEKQFEKEISERVSTKFNEIKQTISESLLESTKKYMEERDDNKNSVEDEKEQLDEISKNTLKNYIKGASQDYARHAMKVQQARSNRSKISSMTNTNDYSNEEMKALRKAQNDMYSANSEDEAKHMKNARKREKGISKAVDKLTEESLNGLSE